MELRAISAHAATSSTKVVPYCSDIFERRYLYFLPVIPAPEEVLLAPFHVADKAVGTIWAVMHSDRRMFDAEDDRVMASLGKIGPIGRNELNSGE